MVIRNLRFEQVCPLPKQFDTDQPVASCAARRTSLFRKSSHCTAQGRDLAAPSLGSARLTIACAEELKADRTGAAHSCAADRDLHHLVQ